MPCCLLLSYLQLVFDSLTFRLGDSMSGAVDQLTAAPPSFWVGHTHAASMAILVKQSRLMAIGLWRRA